MTKSEGAYMEIVKRNSHFIDNSFSVTTGIIDPQFRNVVLTHIIGNYSSTVQMPLFLAIHGSPGEGKTFQTLQICHEHNIRVCYYSGSELSGNYERDSIIELSEDYKRACNYYNDGEYCVIIIDDFHLSPASTKKGIGTTVNSQLLTGYLMNLCDKAKSSQVPSIPIILLGNTFKNIYDPLKRDGRMDFYHWIPPLNLKKQILIKLFKEYLSFPDYIKLSKFIEDYKNYPISFFSEIRNDIVKNIIGDVVNELGHQDIEKYIAISQQKQNMKIKISQLYEFAENRVKATSLSNKGDEWEI